MKMKENTECFSEEPLLNLQFHLRLRGFNIFYVALDFNFSIVKFAGKWMHQIISQQKF